MTEKLIRSLLIAALLAMFLILPVKAQTPENEVLVFPILDGETFTITANDSIILYYWWTSLTPGLVRVFLNAEDTVYTLYNQDSSINRILQPGDTRVGWSEPFKADPLAGWGGVTPNSYYYASEFAYPFGKLPIGTYKLTMVQTLKHPLIDGFHQLRDPETGERLYPPPSIYMGEDLYFNATITIIVTP